MSVITRVARALPGRRRLGRLRNTLLGRRMRSVLNLNERAFLRLFVVESVTKALAAGDVTAAGDALSAHYQTRSLPIWPPFPVHMTQVAQLSGDELLQQAERLLEHRFELASEPEVRFGKRIDWQFDPTPDPRRRWARELHRHRWVIILGAAYQHNGDERYARKFVELISDWIISNPPPPHKNEAHIAWTLMGVGMRCSVWPTAFSIFLRSPAFDRAAQLLMLRSISDHGRFIYLFKTHDNHLLRESNGLAAIAASFPEFKAADSWQQRALERLAQELQAQVNVDGSHIEMSTGYQWLVAEEFEASLDIVQRAGWHLPFGDLTESLESIYAMLMHTCRPDGGWPQLSDGFMVAPALLREQLATAGAKLGREDFRFVATTGREGVKPAVSSLLLPCGGLTIMRSDWSLDARYLLMDCGPFGGVHGHEDKLSIEVCAYGQPFLVDPGSYTYNSDDPFRTHLVSSMAHNTVLVDGLSQVRRWQEQHRAPQSGVCENVEWLSTDSFDFAEATYSDGYGTYSFKFPEQPQIDRSVTHRRSVLFVKPSYWLVIDEMEADGIHEYQRLFQSAEDIEMRKVETGVCLRATASGATLQVLNPIAEQVELHCLTGNEDPLAGWVSNGQRNHKQPAMQLIMTSTATDTESLLTLIYPAPGGIEAPVVSLRRVALTEGDGVAVCVMTRDYEDWLLISKGAGEKRFGDLTSKARIAGFRKQTNGETITLFESKQPVHQLEPS